MIAIDFGHFCFNNPSSEQNILIVLAPKSEYSSLDEFVTQALIYLESDGEFYDKWTEMYRERTYSAVTDEEKRWMKTRFDEMNQQINILYELIIPCKGEMPRVQIEDLCEGCISLCETKIV